VTLAWQAAFLVIARDPVRYRLLMIPAIIEKATYVIALLLLFLNGRIPGLAFAPARRFRARGAFRDGMGPNRSILSGTTDSPETTTDFADSSDSDFAC